MMLGCEGLKHCLSVCHNSNHNYSYFTALNETYTVCLIQNSLNKHHMNCMANSKEND